VKLRVILLAAALCLASQALMAEWQVLENCRLVPNQYNDGDSFHVRHNGREYIFRLYFVDAPETDNSLPERVAEQAAYFGITSQQAIEIGLDAQYAMEQLLAQPFDVVTRWQDAGGRSRLPRHYAFVFIDGVAGPKAADYAAVLVAHGFARVHGVKAKPGNANITAGELEAIYRANRTGGTR
jgi:endonuclease YncB( thermonuclease family)